MPCDGGIGQLRSLARARRRRATSYAFGFGRQLVPEQLGEQRVHDRVEPVLGEAVPIVLGLPYVDVAKAALRSLDGDMADQALRRIVAETLLDPSVNSASIGTSWLNAYGIATTS